MWEKVVPLLRDRMLVRPNLCNLGILGYHV